MERDSNGMFVKTTGSTQYIRAQRDGKNLMYHRLVWEDNFGKIPQGLIIHHIDGNKKNNSIDNLALCTITGHNRMHSHEPWNKGVTVETSEKFARLIDKAQANRRKHYMKIWGEWKSMVDNGMTEREVSDSVGKYERTVRDGIKKYIKYRGEQ